MFFSFVGCLSAAPKRNIPLASISQLLEAPINLLLHFGKQLDNQPTGTMTGNGDFVAVVGLIQPVVQRTTTGAVGGGKQELLLVVDS